MPLGISDQIESYLEEQDEEVDIIELYERLRILSEKPLDINKANFDDLQELRLLSDIQINDILSHIEKFGTFLSIEEFQTIPSLTVADIIRIRPFLKIGANDKLNISIPGMISSTNNELYLKWSRNLEKKKGYIKSNSSDSPYTGNADKYFLRWRSNYENKFRMGFILEKDPGEDIFKSASNLGFDYLTAHIYLSEYNHTIKSLAIGDYTISMGQGLIASSSFGAGKSAFVMNLKKGGRTIKPYNSVNENGYMRGVAATFRIGENVEWSLFGSSVRRDGNGLDIINQSGDEQDIFFSSLQTSGNHRTISELEDKNVVGLKSVGTTIKLQNRSFKIALNSQNHFFDGSLDRSDQLYNLYRFEGKYLSNLSLDFSYRYRNYNLFGETAYSSTGGIAQLYGVLIGLDRRASLAILYRNYEKDYNALEPNAFGESSTINNEKGIYLGFEYLISNRWQLRAYADVWKHSWLKFGIDSPSGGKENLLRLDYNIKRRLSAYIQYSFEEKNSNLISESDKVTLVQNRVKQKIRVHFNNHVSKNLELRTRLELSLYKATDFSESGYLLFQDFIYRSINSPISYSARIAFFDTGGYDSRIFAYENSLLYEFSIPSYFDQGFKYYINVRYDITRSITGELRFSRIHKTDVNYFGSGNELIEEDTKSEIKVQLRYQF